MAKNTQDSKSIYDFEVTASDGARVSMKKFEGKVLLVVNVASKCGFTRQYTGLEELSKKYKDRGLEVVGFPCNQFGGQEPGTDAEIQEFCQLNFGVTFPVMSKIAVNGADADPLFVHLKAAAPGLLDTQAVKWNFTKFLVSRDGKTVARFAPNTEPRELEKAIEARL